MTITDRQRRIYDYYRKFDREDKLPTYKQASKSFNDAIEAKVTAEQEALTQKNKLEQVKYESEQKIVAAEAQAKAIEIQAKAIQHQWGAEYVKLKWIEKWNGQLPTTMAGDDTSLLIMKQ